jgi:phosphatidate phosphatase PAH1
MRSSAVLPITLLLSGCPSGDALDSAACVPPFAVATDIDETLTLSDGEWLDQLADPTCDPALRPDADTLMRAYAERGYTILYVTARGEEVELSDGRSAREATEDWLLAHDFPLVEGALYLAEGYGVTGESAVTYKAGVIDDRTASGWTTAWAYGNADSDILAFQAAGIPDDHIFLVGELAGTMGVEPIPGEEAYTSHLDSQLPNITPVTCD